MERRIGDVIDGLKISTVANIKNQIGSRLTASWVVLDSISCLIIGNGVSDSAARGRGWGGGGASSGCDIDSWTLWMKSGTHTTTLKAEINRKQESNLNWIFRWASRQLLPEAEAEVRGRRRKWQEVVHEETNYHQWQEKCAPAWCVR